MRRWCWPFVALLLLSAGTAVAGQGPDVISGTSPQPTDPNHQKTMIDLLIERGKSGQPMQVDPAQASLCNVCGQPLFKHADPEFRCVPDTKKNGQLQEIREIDVTCPVCTAPFKAAQQGNINIGEGEDRDFCPHSVGKIAVYSSVWMCPECGYAAVGRFWGKRPDDLAKDIGPETVSAVRETLAAPTRKRMIELAGLKPVKQNQDGEPVYDPQLLKFGTYIRQTQIPDWVKYDNALKLIEAAKLKVPHTVLAKLEIEAAYACRHFVCSEVSVSGMDPVLFDSLSKSIRKINNFLAKECIELRLARKEPLVDPNAVESDPDILELAAQRIIEKGNQMVTRQVTEGQDQRTVEASIFTAGDMFVLHLDHAGFLDRQGRYADAVKALEAARQVISGRTPNAGGSQADKDLVGYIERQVTKLREVVDQRLTCLKMEREHQYRAADQLMQILYFGSESDRVEPARTAYLIGELLRRDGAEPDAAKAWFEAALALFKHPRWDREALAIAKRQLPKMDFSELQDLVQSDRIKYQTWAQAQMRLLDGKTKGKGLSNNIQGALDKVKGRLGAETADAGNSEATAKPVTPATPDTTTKPVTPETPKGPAVAVKGPAPDDNPPVQPKTTPPDTTAKPASGKPDTPAARAGKTRDEVFAAYYQALKKYQAEKGEPAPRLSALSEGHYLDETLLSHDASGKLLCPESGQALLYSRTALGSADRPLFIPIGKSLNAKRLYGDGSIKE
ncbi:MAG: DUF2225 domain-containing protein [Planctomycetes bacterium]|nr:DUF2225 domain-containing protein [Planctomycetota bacterium]